MTGRLNSNRHRIRANLLVDHLRQSNKVVEIRIQMHLRLARDTGSRSSTANTGGISNSMDLKSPRLTSIF